MDSTMRDLDRIQEHPADASSSFPTMGLLAVLTVLMVFGLGLWLGGADVADHAPVDVLAHFQPSSEEDVEPPGGGDAPDVRLDGMTFPEALSARALPSAEGPLDERAEVAAAVALAEAELGLSPRSAGSSPALSPSAGKGEAAPSRPAAIPPIEAVVPAAVTAGHGSQILERARRTDPLVATALPRSTRPMAEAGHEGPFTLQVISYRSRASAEAFAAGLRARGHQAFVIAADLLERGRVYRVRIGPFERMRHAQAYRRRFERDERMNTLVIRRPDPPESGD